MLPYFLRSESNANYPRSPWHGTDGPIRVRACTAAESAQPFVPRGLRFGRRLSHRAMISTARNPKVTVCGRGRSATVGAIPLLRPILRPALSRPNLTVLTHTRVTRLCDRIRPRDRCPGRAVRPDPGRLRATRETVLAAGAIQSPQILMLSGVGDARELERVGVGVPGWITPGVGANYHDHLAVAVLMETSNTLSYGLSVRTLPRSRLEPGAVPVCAQRPAGQQPVRIHLVHPQPCRRIAAGSADRVPARAP